MATIVLENNVIKTEPLVFDENLGGLGTIIFKALKTYGNKIVQIEAKTGKSDTFANLLQKSVRTAIALRKRGIKKGDIIAMCTGHHLNACVPFVAAQFLGAILFSLEPSLAISDCVGLLKQVEPKLIFVIKSRKDHIMNCLQLSNAQTDLVVFEDFEKVFSSPQTSEDAFEPVYITDAKETALIYFSSGSTGLPKPICISHYSMMTVCDDLTHYGTCVIFGDCTEENPVYLTFSNWYWYSSGWNFLCCIVKGACKVLSDDMNCLEFWKAVDKYKITSVYITPLKAIELCHFGIPERVNTKSLTSFLYGGSSLPLEYILQLRKLLPHTLVNQCYGQTEAGILTRFPNMGNLLQRKYRKQKPESIGLPLKGIVYKVIDPDTNQAVSFNQPGELRVKTKQLMSGYYNRDSSSCYDEEGYYQTGDIVYYDKDFCFFFVQRIKELMVYRDWVVYPAMLENILLQHPAVKNAVVIGKPHKIDGDHPMGVVILKEECSALEEELIEFVNEKVQDRQRIRAGIVFVDSYPLGPTGKLHRLALIRSVLNRNSIT